MRMIQFQTSPWGRNPAGVRGWGGRFFPRTHARRTRPKAGNSRKGLSPIHDEEEWLSLFLLLPFAKGHEVAVALMHPFHVVVFEFMDEAQSAFRDFQCVAEAFAERLCGNPRLPLRSKRLVAEDVSGACVAVILFAKAPPLSARKVEDRRVLCVPLFKRLSFPPRNDIYSHFFFVGW
jgi:hypothetical protein